MKEFIYRIEDDESDESEVFIGWIRKHGHELIRCKDCTKYKPCVIDKGYHYCAMSGALVEEEYYCCWAERKEE